MPRTTVNLDAPILRDLKRLQKKERIPLGRLISDLLAAALAGKAGDQTRPGRFRWISRSLGARVDLADKEAVRAALEQDSERAAPFSTSAR